MKVAWKHPEPASPPRQLIAALIVVAAWLPLAVLWWGSLLLVLVTPLMFLTAGTLMRRVSVTRTATKRPRPDYSLIASMERPIWGQAFDHAGAPGLGASGIIRAPRPQSPRTDRDHCWMCEDRHQMQNLAAHYRAKHDPDPKENGR